jgi:integrase
MVSSYTVGGRYNMIQIIKPTSTFREACNLYHKSTSCFSSLKVRTQKDYINNLNKACDTKVDGNKQLGNVRLKDLRHRHLTIAYDSWVVSGLRSANYIATCVSIVLNYSIRYEAIQHNPMSLVKKSQPKQRKVKWTPDQVKLFLDTAYSDFKWRSIGLIFHMAYEWAQRVGDMRNLKWESIDFDNKRMDLEQSKRGAEVHLPIGDNLLRMLIQQKEDFNFQEYVAPRTSPKNNVYSNYTINEIHKLNNEVKEEANLPKELQVRDLRRTAITEMVEAGVDLVSIMQVSGHQSVASVRPYLVNTYSGASSALERRFNNDDKH